jgi:ribosome assembly protein YihI (activator of Der GTPase)
MVLLNVMDDRHRDEIAHTHLTPQKETDLGAADIVLDELLDDIDIVLPRLQAGQGLINIGAAALYDERLGGISELLRAL